MVGNAHPTIAMSNEQLRVRARKMPLSLCTKVMQPVYYFGKKNVVCNDTSAKRYRKAFIYSLICVKNFLLIYQALKIINNKQPTTNNQ